MSNSSTVYVVSDRGNLVFHLVPCLLHFLTNAKTLFIHIDIDDSTVMISEITKTQESCGNPHQPRLQINRQLHGGKDKLIDSKHVLPRKIIQTATNK